MRPRIILSWACYWIGDGVSRTIEPLFGKWFEWPYRLYSKFMCWSDNLQDNDPRGPWSPVADEEYMNANREFGDRTLLLFDNSKSGPLTDKELRDIRLAAMPYLLQDGRKSDLALLIARLIETVDAAKLSAYAEAF